MPFYPSYSGLVGLLEFVLWCSYCVLSDSQLFSLQVRPMHPFCLSPSGINRGSDCSYWFPVVIFLSDCAVIWIASSDPFSVY